MITVAEGEYSFFGAGFFFISSGSAEGSVKFVFIQSLQQSFCFHYVRVFATAMIKWIDPGFFSFFIDVDN